METLQDIAAAIVVALLCAVIIFGSAGISAAVIAARLAP